MKKFCILEAEEKRKPAIHSKCGFFRQNRKLSMTMEITVKISCETIYQDVLFSNENISRVPIKYLLLILNLFSFSLLGLLISSLGGSDRMSEFPYFLRLEACVIIAEVNSIVYLSCIFGDFSVNVLVRNRTNKRRVVFWNANGVRCYISE